MDPLSHLENLAPELLISILLNLPDLETLDTILRASPASYRLFSLRGLEIFDRILAIGITHKYSCALIRIMALFHCKAIPNFIRNQTDFQDFVRFHTTSFRYTFSDYEPTEDYDNYPAIEWPEIAWPADISVVELRQLLVVNRDVVKQTIGCLGFYLERFGERKPMRLVDKTFKFTNAIDRTKEVSVWVKPWNQKPEMEAVVVRATGSPSWVEEQRVYRSFWRLRLFDEVRRAECDGLVDWELSGISMSAQEGLYGVDSYNVHGEGNYDEYTGRYGGDWPNVMDLQVVLDQELIESALFYVRENPEIPSNSTFYRMMRERPARLPNKMTTKKIGMACQTTRPWNGSLL